MYKLLVLFALLLQSMAEFVFNDTIFMPKLDRQLTSLLTEPQPGAGAQFLKDAFYFYQNLDAAADIATGGEDKKGEEVYLDFMRDGGPLLIKRSYDNELLEKVFKWGPDELEEFTAILSAVEKAWNRLERGSIDNAK